MKLQLTVLVLCALALMGVRAQTTCSTLNELECPRGTCSASSGVQQACAWDGTLQSCGCPVRECKLFTTATDCGAYVCPNSNTACRWDDLQRFCNCPTTSGNVTTGSAGVSTTGSSVRECKIFTTATDCGSNFCPNSNTACQWDDLQRFCNCPTTVTTTGSSGGISTTGSSVRECKIFTTATDCSSNFCPNSNTACQWDDLQSFCNCPTTVTTTGSSGGVSTTGSSVRECSANTDMDMCTKSRCPNGQSVCQWFATEKKCDCPTNDIPCDMWESKGDCATHTCPQNNNAQCVWSETVTECCVDSPNKPNTNHTDYNCTSLVPLGRDRCNQVYGGLVCQWTCATGQTQSVSTSCACSDTCNFITDSRKCVSTLCPTTKERCLWVDTNECVCEDDTQNNAHAMSVGVAQVVVATVAALVIYL